MITKDQIVKALYNSAKKTVTTKGVEMTSVFADQADAILNLIQSDISGPGEQLLAFLKYLDKDYKPAWITHEGIVKDYLSEQ